MDRATVRRAYEADVAALAGSANRLRREGWAAEQIARELVERRNDLKRAYRRHDDPMIVSLLEARNRVKYGDPVGPTADDLFARYGGWNEVITAAARPARIARG